MFEHTTPEVDHENERSKRLIWDLPTRLFHWSLVFFFALAWLTSEGDEWLSIHILSGYSIAGLIGFRLIWGLLGSYYARFSSFSYSLSEVKAHLKGLLSGRPHCFTGHNPAGSWAIYTLLGGCLLIVFSGLFVFGGEENHGVISSASVFVGWLARNVHETLAGLIMAIVVLHIGGVIVESYLCRENLGKSMLNGYKLADSGATPVSPHTGVGIILMISLLGFLLWSAVSGLIPIGEDFEAPFSGPALATSGLWQEECSDCHLAYHPSLLPARSWTALLDAQQNHFGEDLSLEADTFNTLKRYAQSNSAEQGATEPARKIMARMPDSATPLRITETRYWKHKHNEISASVWAQSNVNGKAQCESCHQDALQGWFEDSAMEIPDPASKG